MPSMTMIAGSDLTSTMTSRTAAMLSGCCSRIEGSNSMPTETKNSTAKASRNGSESAAA